MFHSRSDRLVVDTFFLLVLCFKSKARKYLIAERKSTSSHSLARMPLMSQWGLLFFARANQGLAIIKIDFLHRLQLHFASAIKSPVLWNVYVVPGSLANESSLNSWFLLHCVVQLSRKQRRFLWMGFFFSNSAASSSITHDTKLFDHEIPHSWPQKLFSIGILSGMT